MKYGFVFSGGTPAQAVELARLAEDSGWDAFFVWEVLYGPDAWVILGAMAVQTQTIRLGTMLTPPSRMRPWKLASEVATVDQLSGGRVILSVGLGALEVGFAKFGEVTDRRQRAERLDESLEIMTRLWSGEPFSFAGKHYTVQDYNPAASFNQYTTRPVQQPRVPIWVVGGWPSERSMGRAARWDGLLPNLLRGGRADNPLSPEDIRAMAAWVRERRAGSDAPYDIVVEGVTPGDDPAAAAEQVRPWQDAGATWWIEALWELPASARKKGSHEFLRRRIEQGPPRVD